MDVPGLALHGSGNRMEVRIADIAVFENFCQEVTEGRDVPEFQRSPRVPESFQWRVIEVFRRAGTREIPAKTFRDHYNSCFPTDKLQCRDYGYRDVKGLLANLPILEKVGGKYNTRYVLKRDIDFSPIAGQGNGVAAPA